MIDRDEATREAAWSEAWRQAAHALAVDADTDDGETLDLIWDEAAKRMKAWDTPLPKSVTHGHVEQ
ncbi:hypothetical protein C6Q04_30165 [Burkholderia multivorans]|uniref:hypothetical protein n=1 Tax=Burkholderia cepacia complex TaxID=87882 RepID=UPI00018E38D6|nr:MULTISPECIES: hypothetical protein [Burkholderia cepacia complex]EED97277.1 hypothetical protein BURMUCGD1_6606 [Burkholderia multivorans CGD1]PRE30456.1 hypothetical protein C6P79_06490 [Burkholderia multivorans]PRF42424.1 hypothetical protein C6Q04_30165 [Burkholderia multivorans]QSL64000.1 hypothetical protein G0D86_29915 [Burkholderia multivorans]